MSAFQGFIPVEGEGKKRFIYAEYREARGNAPTLVLLNGLSDSCRSWDAFLSHLGSEGRGILRLDFRGQGRSLEREIEEAGAIAHPVSIGEQTRDVDAALRHFGLASKRIQLVGVSYGGGVALNFASVYPERVEKVILIVPYLIRLDRAFPFQRLWAHQFDVFRGAGILPATTFSAAEKWYHQFLSRYMDHRFRPALPDDALRGASIQLTFGILDFDGFQVLPKLPSRSVHLITVGQDTLVPRSLYAETWARLPERVKESWLFIEDGQHLILDQYPALCGRWVEMIVQGDPRISGGRRFSAQGYSLEIRDEDRQDFSFARSGLRSVM